MFGFTTWFQYLPLWRSFDARLSIRLKAQTSSVTVREGSLADDLPAAALSIRTPLPRSIAIFHRESQAYPGLLAFPATRRLPADSGAITVSVTRTLC